MHSVFISKLKTSIILIILKMFCVMLWQLELFISYIISGFTFCYNFTREASILFDRNVMSVYSPYFIIILRLQKTRHHRSAHWERRTSRVSCCSLKHQIFQISMKFHWDICIKELKKGDTCRPTCIQFHIIKMVSEIWPCLRKGCAFVIANKVVFIICTSQF